MPSDECGLRSFLGLHESTNSDVSCDSQVTTMPDRDEDTKPEKASAFLHSPHSHRTSNQLPSHLGERLHSNDGEATRNGRDGRTSASTTARQHGERLLWERLSGRPMKDLVRGSG